MNSTIWLALALVFFTRKQIRKLFQERRDRIADALLKLVKTP